jgi:Ca-activated chloride channel homolog
VFKRITILGLLLFGSSFMTPAQDTLQLKVDVDLVTLDVYVDDAAGKPITNLAREDFTILEDGEPRELRSFDSAETPYNILLLFDRSASTEDQWPFLARAIARFVDQLDEQQRVALAAFDEKPQMLVNWSSAQQFSRQAVPILSENSGTNVYRALEWAAEQLRSVKGRKGVLVLTDGVDNRLSSALVSFGKNRTPTIAPPQADRDFQKMLRIVKESRAPVYFVGVNTDQNPDPKATPNAFDLLQRTAGRERMEIVANQSNGSLRLPRELRELSALYEKIGRELGHSYSIGFAPKTAAHDGSFHRIDIRLRDTSLRITQSRPGYYAQ